MGEMWTAGMVWDEASGEDGIVLTHVNGQPPVQFKAMWPRSGEHDDVIYALENLVDDLYRYSWR